MSGWASPKALATASEPLTKDQKTTSPGDHRYDFFAGARGVRLAEAGLQSSAEGRRLQLGELVA